MARNYKTLTQAVGLALIMAMAGGSVAAEARDQDGGGRGGWQGGRDAGRGQNRGNFGGWSAGGRAGDGQQRAPQMRNDTVVASPERGRGEERTDWRSSVQVRGDQPAWAQGFRTDRDSANRDGANRDLGDRDRGYRDRGDRDGSRNDTWRNDDRRGLDRRDYDRARGRNDWGYRGDRPNYDRPNYDRDGWRGNDRFHGRDTMPRYAWDRGWRQDRRYDWQNYRSRYRNLYRAPRYYAPYGWGYGYRRFSIGFMLWSGLFADQYWISDPYYYRLPPAYGSLRWVRYYNDALLVDVATGYVVDAQYDFFW